MSPKGSTAKRSYPSNPASKGHRAYGAILPRLRQFAEDHREGFTYREVQPALGITKTQAMSNLNNLVRNGELVPISKFKQGGGGYPRKVILKTN